MRLDDYLIKNRINIKQFSKLTGLSRGAIYNILNYKKIFLETAMIIEKATDGQVTVYDLLQDTESK
jgi:DNA-binding transcriptional regulator YdaS (Cro superfamily)